MILRAGRRETLASASRSLQVTPKRWREVPARRRLVLPARVGEVEAFPSSRNPDKADDLRRPENRKLHTCEGWRQRRATLGFLLGLAVLGACCPRSVTIRTRTEHRALSRRPGRLSAALHQECRRTGHRWPVAR